MRWPRSARHARWHAIALATLLWIAAAVVGFSGTDDRGIAGPLKGADFVQFYTLGYLARSHQTASMYDPVALHEAQSLVVPASQTDLYPPVYPPQAALLFAPFSGWSYQRALLSWSLLTIGLYALIVWSAWRAVAAWLPDRAFVLAAAAAFPPFWSLVLHGQVTILLLLAFWAGWLALERRRPFLAGIAFGLLALKPQFGVPLAVVVLVCGEWAMLAGALTSVLVQVIAVSMTLGVAVVSAFLETVPLMVRFADSLEAKPFMSHSIRALTRLAPAWIGLPVWAALCVGVLWWTVRVWRSDAPIRVRLGVVILASVLVNPHLLIYDATVLALPLVWCAAYMQEPGRQAQSSMFWMTVYWLFAALFAPTAAVVSVQVSVLLMAWLFVLVARQAVEPGVERAAALTAASTSLPLSA